MRKPLSAVCGYIGEPYKSPPGELFPFFHYALQGVTVEKELFTLVA